VEAAIAVNAASFVVSALLLAGVRLARATGEPRTGSRWTPLRDLREGLRHVSSARTVRSVIVVMGFALLLLPAKAPAEIVMVRDRLTDGSAAAVATALGMLTAAFGGGMVAGSALAPAFAGRLRREHALAGAIGLIGLCYLGAARADSVIQLALVWLVSGAAGGLLNVAYETLLQEQTPDRFRGRVFALAEATQDAMYVAGALFVGAFGVAGGFAPVGFATLGVALLGFGLLAAGREDGVRSAPVPLAEDLPVAA
jgi:MFS family permease